MKVAGSRRDLLLFIARLSTSMILLCQYMLGAIASQYVLCKHISYRPVGGLEPNIVKPKSFHVLGSPGVAGFRFRHGKAEAEHLTWWWWAWGPVVPSRKAEFLFFFFSIFLYIRVKGGNPNPQIDDHTHLAG